MSFRRLAVFPLIMALVPALIFLAIDAMRTRQIALRVEVETVKLLGLTGSIIAARAFDRGEHLRRAWLFNGSCYAFLLLRDLLFGVWLRRESGQPAQYLEAFIVLLANMSQVMGVWMLSRTWQIAGIALPWSPLKRNIVRWIGIVVGVAIAGPALYVSIDGALGGEVSAIVHLVSGVGDVFSLALIVPVLLTTVALRGGLLSWPWGLMTASQFGWLFYDVARIANQFVPMQPATATMITEMCRTLACTYCFSAGIAQRAVCATDPGSGAMPMPNAA